MICPNCGKINADDLKFCGDCGTKLTESSGIVKTNKNEGYLVCNDCGGLYKLKEGESPGDFESCQCGGKLIHTTDPTSLKKSSDKSAAKDDLTGNILGRINKRVFIIGALINIVYIIFLNLFYDARWIFIGGIDWFTLAPVLFISCLIAGFLLYKKDYYTIVINGAIIGLIPFLYTVWIYFSYWGIYDTFGAAILSLFFYLIVGAVSSIIGGFARIKFINKT